MGAAFLSFWCVVGKPKNPFEFVRFLGRKKKGKGLGKWDLYIHFAWLVRLGIGLFLKMRFFLYRGRRPRVYLLWSETKKTILDCPSNITVFIDWICCK